MGKITFRADDDLVDELEAFDASKSEVMREALRAYLGRSDAGAPARTEPAVERGSIDELVREHVDDLLDERLAERRDRRDVSVTVSVDDEASGRRVDDPVRVDRSGRKTSTPSDATTSTASDAATSDPESSCGQCGETIAPDHVYCPNCGEKAAHRLFCECGDEVRSDWSFCPGCGRRTPAADVLESG